MGERSFAEETLAGHLTRRGLPFEEQVKIAGHHIDFVVYLGRPVLLDVNGDRWHRWAKIVECDRKKIERVLLVDEVPLGVWWSRLQRNPDEVLDTVEKLGAGPPALPWWDWAVDLDALTEKAAGEVRRLLEEGKALCESSI